MLAEGQVLGPRGIEFGVGLGHVGLALVNRRLGLLLRALAVLAQADAGGHEGQHREDEDDDHNGRLRRFFRDVDFGVFHDGEGISIFLGR